MNFLIGLFVGLCFGAILMYAISSSKPKTSGTFYMDFSDPNKDVCRLDLEEDINDIYEKEYIFLKVETQE